MLTRVLLLLLVASLAPPIAAVTPFTEASDGSRGGISVEARDKKKGRKGKKFVRLPVTQTFTNPAKIDNPNGDIDERKPADLYPSEIVVAGFRKGTILDVDVILHGFTHDVADDADLLLTATQLPGRRAVVMSDTCGELVTNLTLGLDDEAVAPLPQASCPSGTFQPANRGINADTFPPPGPGSVAPGNSALSVFDGGDPNGTWQLFMVDDIGDLDPGSIENGWSLRITAVVDVRKDKKGGKKGKGGR
jgi:hypothetical protein